MFPFHLISLSLSFSLTYRWLVGYDVCCSKCSLPAPVCVCVPLSPLSFLSLSLFPLSAPLSQHSEMPHSNGIDYWFSGKVEIIHKQISITISFHFLFPSCTGYCDKCERSCCGYFIFISLLFSGTTSDTRSLEGCRKTILKRYITTTDSLHQYIYHIIFYNYLDIP